MGSIGWTKVNENTDSKDLNKLWKNLKLEKVNEWTQPANILINKMNDIFCNGGIEIRKYKIIETETNFDCLMLDKHLAQNIYCNNDILDDRKYLNFDGKLPEIKILDHFTDIYTLSGNLAKIMANGGAYGRIEPKYAWKIATEFVENEFENRFDDFNYYVVEIINSSWFHNIAWDYSLIITDRKKYDIIFIDITDTD